MPGGPDGAERTIADITEAGGKAVADRGPGDLLDKPQFLRGDAWAAGQAPAMLFRPLDWAAGSQLVSTFGVDATTVGTRARRSGSGVDESTT
jgi:hypothetical protein